MEGKEILSTYSCVISHLKNRPGARVEDMFRSSSVSELEAEKKSLEELFESVNKKHYYLFGSEACTILDNEGIDTLIDKINNEDFTEFDTRCHSVLDNPADLLFQVMGWGNYSVLTEEEYNKLHESIN
jgi:hypothetical protein